MQPLSRNAQSYRAVLAETRLLNGGSRMPGFVGIVIAIGLFAPGVALTVLGIAGLRGRGDVMRKVFSILSLVVGLSLVAILSFAVVVEREPWNALMVVAAGGLSVAAGIFWVMVLADCLMYETREGNERIVWTLVIIFTLVIGAGLYYFLRRPRRLAEGQSS